MESPFPTSRKGNVKYVESYDFKHPKLFSKEIMRTLGTIHEALGRNLGRIFSTTLRYKVDLYLNRIYQKSPEEFLKSIDTPSVIYVLQIEGMDGELIIELPPDLCIHMIERQSGGQNTHLVDSRSLTMIEEKIIRRIMQSVNKEIVNAWEPFKDFTIQKMVYEHKPENVHLASVDPIIVGQFEIDMVEEQSGIRIAYTYSLLKEVLNDTILKKDLKNKMEQLTEEELDAYKRTVSEAKVKLHTLLGTTQLSLSEVLNLQEGDAIPLRQKADQPLEIRVNGKTKLKGFPGMIQGRKAVKVFEVIDEINEQELV